MRELTELKQRESLVDALLADQGLLHLEADPAARRSGTQPEGRGRSGFGTPIGGRPMRCPMQGGSARERRTYRFRGRVSVGDADAWGCIGHAPRTRPTQPPDEAYPFRRAPVRPKSAAFERSVADPRKSRRQDLCRRQLRVRDSSCRFASISALRWRGHSPFVPRVGTAAVDCNARKDHLNLESSDVSRFDAENRAMCVGDRSDD